MFAIAAKADFPCSGIGCAKGLASVLPRQSLLPIVDHWTISVDWVGGIFKDSEIVAGSRWRSCRTLSVVGQTGHWTVAQTPAGSQTTS
jgi:hypothetical protein